jgi:hypothetical protein
MSTIKGGDNGNVADVNKFKQLHTRATIEDDFGFAADKGEAYRWSSVTYNMTANDTIQLVKNTSTTKLHMTGLWLSTDVDTIAKIHYPTTNVTVAGTVVVGVNTNTSSSNVAEASAATDETGNTIGDIFWAHEIYAANGPTFIPLAGSVLAKNKSIAVDFVADCGVIGATFEGHYEVEE